MATVKHLWEKVAAIRRTKALGSDDLKVSISSKGCACELVDY